MVLRKDLHLEQSHAVFITTTILRHFPIFNHKNIAEAFLYQFRETLQFFNVEAIGYVLMPSHLHAILHFPKVIQMPKFMQSLKSLSSRKIYRMLNREMIEKFTVNGRFRLWNPRYDDVYIYSTLQFRIKLEYIHNNPVKKDWSHLPVSGPTQVLQIGFLVKGG
ncbi:MAG: transposase [Candidatus Zixiibacteriota bacterium]